MNTRTKRSVCLILALCTVTVAVAASALPAVVPVEPIGRLLAGDGATENNFGYAVAIDGDLAAVGAPRWNNDGLDYQGATYVFHFEGGAWQEKAKLRLDPPGAYDAFGAAVDLYGGTLAVGAFGKNQNSPALLNEGGAVIVYTGGGDTWTEQATLQPADLVEYNRFGSSVALFADTLIVGAPNVAGFANEAVYIYSRSLTTWELDQKIPAPPGAVNFGASVVLSESTALVCAPGSTETPTKPAAVYAYKRAGLEWAPAGQLVLPGAEVRFGCGLAFDGERAVFSTYADPDTPGDTARGDVFTYNGSAWAHSATLTPPIDDPYSFIVAAALEGDRIVLGAADSYGPGIAFVYDRQGDLWVNSQTLRPQNEQINSQFGRDVALDGDSVLVGAPGETPLLDAEEGAVYAYRTVISAPYALYLPISIGPPRPPAPPGAIVYVDQGVANETDLFTIGPNGGGKTNLTNSVAREYGPRWSPDRQRIAYSRFNGTFDELVVMNADGGNPQVVPTPGLTLLGGPDWSPDGAKLAFHAYDNNLGWDIYVVGVDGGGLTNLTTAVPHGATQPAWSPDGQRIIFCIEAAAADLMVINADGANPVNLTNNDRTETSPDWSPDGAKILFTSQSNVDKGLHVMPAAGGASTLVIPQGQNGRWWADGTQIVLSGGGGGIFRANADGSALTVVDPSLGAGAPDW